MPHIFPRRFLRTRDVLDPNDFNEDIQPVHDLLSGKLDRTNFNAASLKNNLRPGPTSTLPEPDGPCVAEGAYFNVYTSQIESKMPLYNQLAIDNYEIRPPPNFVRTNETTFRRSYAGTDSSGFPSIIPNSGAWSAVRNADLSGAQQINFTSGQTKVWICAYG
jgi:hypothetical protein